MGKETERAFCLSYDDQYDRVNYTYGMVQWAFHTYFKKPQKLLDFKEAIIYNTEGWHSKLSF